MRRAGSKSQGSGKSQTKSQTGIIVVWLIPGRDRGHGEDSIYYDQANHYWVAAVSLGYKGGKRARRKVTGRTKTEVKAKLRDLRRDLDSGVRPSATYTIGDALDDWLANGLGGTSDRTKELYRDTVKPLRNG